MTEVRLTGGVRWLNCSLSGDLWGEVGDIVVTRLVLQIA